MRLPLPLAFALAATTVTAAPPSRITNARVETRSAASGLSPVVKAELAARGGAVWIGWSVPATERGSSCCWSGDEGGSASCRGCSLEGERRVEVQGRGDDPVKLEGSDRIRVLLRADGGRVSKIRTFSEDCPVDAGGMPLVWIEDLRPADSVAVLATFVGHPRDDGRGSKRLDDGAVAAIAAHADPSADAALERFVAPDRPLELRKQAAFWMGNARGARGYATLRRLVKDDADSRLREHAIFALTQSREPEAVDAIIEVAHRDADAHVRGQALFWLAQSAARRAPAAIQAALDDDPEVEVKKKAVFALSQLPKDEGVPLLIKVAESHKSYEVRKQAMFWLGQSHDPRALAYFEDVLKR
jgi:HEAT repeat protein